MTLADREDSYPLLQYPSSSTFSPNVQSVSSASYQGQYFDSSHQESWETSRTSSKNVGSDPKSGFRRPFDDSYHSNSFYTAPTQQDPLGIKKDQEESHGGWRQWCLSIGSDWWFIEFVCAILSLICLLATLWILRWQHNRPLPEWEYGITLNAVVSALVTLAKSLMAATVATCLGQLKWTQFYQQSGAPLAELENVDQASRGAWGSLKLLSWPKRR